MKNKEALIDAYIKSKQLSWSDATLKNERYRLGGMDGELLLNPEALYKHLKDERKMKPYTIKTAFTRAADFHEFLMAKGHLKAGTNVFKEFMREKSRLFKKVYAPKPMGMTFEDVVERIKQIEDMDSRNKAFQLLGSGMRVSESSTLTADGMIVGKGNQARSVKVPAAYRNVEYTATRQTLWRHLKKVGLTPHMLRKALATKLAEGNLHVGELMAAMGWSSPQPAIAYLQAHRQNAALDLIHGQLPNQEGEDDRKQVPKPVRKAKRKR